MKNKHQYRYIERQKKLVGESKELWLERNVEFRQLDPTLRGENDDMIRVYGGYACATLQLRGISSLTRGGKPRRLIATASYLDKTEVRALIEKLQEIERTLQ